MGEVLRECGHNSMRVSRIVRKGHVYFSKAYTRMVKRNACAVLFANGKVGEVNYFIWDKSSGSLLLSMKNWNQTTTNPSSLMRLVVMCLE